MSLQVASEGVSIRTGLCEVMLPHNYPVENLIALIRSIRS